MFFTYMVMQHKQSFIKARLLRHCNFLAFKKWLFDSNCSDGCKTARCWEVQMHIRLKKYARCWLQGYHKGKVKKMGLLKYQINTYIVF